MSRRADADITSHGEAGDGDEDSRDAEVRLRADLATDEEIVGVDSYEVAAKSHELANVLAARGEFAEAVTLYERALTIKRRVLGGHHPDVVTTLHNLALLHEAAGNPTEARSLWAEGLAVVEPHLD